MEFAYFSFEDVLYKVNHTPSFTSVPQLSNLSIERRKKTNIELDKKDFYPYKTLEDSLSKYKVQIVRSSRWLNGVLVVIDDTSIVNQIGKLAFVKNILYLGKLPDDINPATFDPGNIQSKTEEYTGFQRAYYDKEHKHPRKQGFAYEQLKMIFDNRYLHLDWTKKYVPTPKPAQVTQ